MVGSLKVIIMHAFFSVMLCQISSQTHFLKFVSFPMSSSQSIYSQVTRKPPILPV